MTAPASPARPRTNPTPCALIPGMAFGRSTLAAQVLLASAVLCLFFPVSTSAQQSPPDAPSTSVPTPPSATSDFARARQLAQQGKIDEAIAQLQTIEASEPATKGLNLELGATFYKKSDYPRAIEYLKKATDADPHNGEAVQL